MIIIDCLGSNWFFLVRCERKMREIQGNDQINNNIKHMLCKLAQSMQQSACKQKVGGSVGGECSY